MSTTNDTSKTRAFQGVGSDAQPQAQDNGAADAQPTSTGLAAKLKDVSPQAILLIGIVLIGGGMLWTMRWFGTRSGMDFRANPMEFTLEAPNRLVVANESRILKDLANSDKIVQVSADKLLRNPFQTERDIELSAMLPEGGGTDAERQRELMRRNAERQARLGRIKDMAEHMRVTSIITGKVPVAVVDGKPVRVGDNLGEFFKVTHISGRDVTLEADGKSYTLALPLNTPGTTTHR